MYSLTVAALAVALVVCSLALVRETRLRRALQRLLQQIFDRWRSHDQNHEAQHGDVGEPDDRRL